MNTRTRSQANSKTIMEQSTPINTIMEDNTELMKMYQDIADLDQIINKMRQEQITKVMEFRKLCIQRKQPNQKLECKSCKNADISHPNMTQKVNVKPNGITGIYTLRGDYENNLYLCGECGRPCIELCSIDSDNGCYQRRYM